MSSKKPPKTVNFSFSDEPPTMNNSIIEDTLNEMTLEDNGVHQSIAEHEPSVPDEAELQIEEKEKIQEEDIFDMTPTLKKVKKDNNLQKEIQELEQEIAEHKPTVEKKPRKKRQITQEHLDKLAKARELAQIARKKKAEERAEAKKLEEEQKELIKKAKVKRVQKLKQEVEEEEPPEQPKGKTNMGLTMADLEEAQYQAILKYDALRKQQKAEKKQQQMVEQEKQKMLNTINRATGQTYQYGARRPDGKLMNRWDSCY